MTRVDQFESVFEAAAKERFKIEPAAIGKVLVVTDLEAGPAAALTDEIRSFLAVLAARTDGAEVAYETVVGSEFGDVQQLLDRVAAAEADLVVAYRHLHSTAWRWPYSLGEYLDVLTQVIEPPVLVIPHPDGGRALPHAVRNTDRVMAITDHLAGDHRLVNVALGLTEPGGRLFLAHIEDGVGFDRFIATIAKIPSIDTETAREEILERLLKDPRDFAVSVREVVAEAGLAIEVEEIVTVGRRLAEYGRLIEEHEIDLVVLYTKDDDQLAMHGLAYPLAVEVRQIPLLLL